MQSAQIVSKLVSASNRAQPAHLHTTKGRACLNLGPCPEICHYGRMRYCGECSNANVCRGECPGKADGSRLDRPRQPITRRRGSSQRAYATRFSSLTSTSLQDGHTTKCKSGNPPSLGTLRTSFIMFPQDGQRCIGRLSAIFMIAIRVCPAGALIAESRREMVAKKQRARTFLPRPTFGRYHRREPYAFCASTAQGSRHDRASEPKIPPNAHHI
jgi:hypothetical protein